MKKLKNKLVDTINRKPQSEEYVEQSFFKVSKENFELMENPPSNFYYNLIETEFEVKKNEFIRKQKIVKTRNFPLDILYISYIELTEI